MTKFRRVVACGASVLPGLFIAGCLDRELQPVNPCLVSGVTEQVNVTKIDKVDLLFMVDNSSSMEDKQANLRAHVPQLVQTLVTGKRRPDDPDPFPPATDLHIAVVTSDMGLPGVMGITGCSGYGDDGLFQNKPHASPENPKCDASYPKFLSYKASDPAGTSASKISQDFGCIANVGAKGCGFEQQLESPLKALWPSSDTHITFLAPAGDPERLGHGDRENAGFLRNDSTKGLSLIAIIILSDEDDGSTADMQLYTPASQLPSDTWVDPSTLKDINLRSLIGVNRDHLYDVKRYIQGFKALRPGQENLVVFAAITGVPLDLVDNDATKAVDFTDQPQRDAFYDRILNDPRMQNVPDMTPSPGKLVVPACLTSFGHGYPGRRYIQVAKGFGENATIYSICEPDYTPALNHVIDLIAKQLRTVCLPRPLIRDASGKVACDVVWELPKAENRPSLETPVDCSERKFLSTPSAGQSQRGSSGGNLCTVTQIAAMAGHLSSGDGWYYDNFSDDVKSSCPAATPQRVAFTAAAKPPSGITVKLQCLNETQNVANTTNGAIPDSRGEIASIGTSCELARSAAGTDADSLCAVRLANGGVDRSLFCHPQTNTCARPCQSENDCPPAWACDKRPEVLAATTSAKRPDGAAICVNPTCGL